MWSVLLSTAAVITSTSAWIGYPNPSLEYSKISSAIVVEMRGPSVDKENLAQLMADIANNIAPFGNRARKYTKKDFLKP